MRRWLSLLLSLMMIFTTVLGDFSWAIAEETEAYSEDFEAEVPLSTEAGDSGLTVDIGDVEWFEPSDPQPEGAGDLPDTADGASEGAAASDQTPEGLEAQPDQAAFAFGYARILSDNTVIGDQSGESASAIATVGKGAVVLCIHRENDDCQVTFESPEGVVTGYVVAENLCPLTETEINALMDAVAAYEAVTLYNEDINWPLTQVDCQFPAQDGTTTEPTVDGEGATTDEPTVDGEGAATDEPTVDGEGAATDEPTMDGEGAVTDEPTVDGEGAATDEPTVDGEGATTDEPTVDGEGAATDEPTVDGEGDVTEPTVDGEGDTIEPTVDGEDGNADMPDVKLDGENTAGGDMPTTYDALNQPRLVLNQTQINLSVKMQATLTATMLDAQGQAMAVDYIYTYLPEDESEAVIDLDVQKGTITALSAGKAKVSVTAMSGFNLICDSEGNAIEAICEINVAEAPAKVKLNASKGSIGYKETFSGLVASAYDADDQEVPATFTYKSSNTKYVTVNAKGEIYGKKTGSAYVYVYAQNGKYARCKVTVKKAPSSLKISPDSLLLSAGGMTSAPLKGTVNSGAACNTFTYTGYDPSIISVSADGVVTAKVAGSTTITVTTYNGVTRNVPVSVVNPPSEVFFTEDALTIGVQEKAQVSAWNRNVDGLAAPSSYTYTVAEADQGILKVDATTGAIEGLSAGQATVFVSTHNGVSTGNVGGKLTVATCVVTVLNAPEGLSLTTTSGNVGYKEKYYNIMDHLRIVVNKGSENQQLLTIAEAENQQIAHGSYTFKSSNTKYVTVDKNGVIYGKTAGKSAYVTITAHNGESVRIKINVKKAPTKVTVSPTKLSMGANGMQYKLTAKVNSGTWSNTYTYTSSNTDVVTVDKDTGLLTSVNPGTATITVKSYNGKKATCKVTVYGEPAEIKLSQSSAVLGVGSRMTLSATAMDNAGATTYSSYVYSVQQDGHVIDIDSATGKITAVSKGEAIVTVKSHNGVSGYMSEKDGWQEARCLVKVVAAPTALKLSKTSITIGYKETFKGIPDLVDFVAPEGENESAAQLSYKSNRTSYVTVNATTGAVYGKKAGYSYITITPDNGAAAVKVKVTVKKAPTKVTLNTSKVTLSEGGQTYQLTPSVNSGAACLAYSWASSNESVVKVSESGLVTTVGTGTATVTVSSFNGKKATCTVNVLAAPVQVFMPETITVVKGQSARVTAGVCGVEGAVSMANYTFATSDSRITLNPTTGELKGLALTGGEDALIYVTTHNGVSTHYDDNGVSVKTVCRVKVIEGPAAIKLDTTGVSIGVGQTLNLNPVLLDSEGKVITGGDFIYQQNGSSLTIGADGTIKGKKVGTSNVTVSCGGLVATCKVQVKKAPTSVKLSPASGTLGVGQVDKFTVKLSSGSGGSYTFSSSNTKVATVENDGTVTAVGIGTATITVKTYNGKTAKAKLTVKKGPEFLVFNTNYIELYDEESGNYKVVYFEHMLPGTTFQLQYLAEAYTSGKVVSYISENDAIATVTSGGKVTAVSEGCTAIVAEASSGVLEMCFILVEGENTPFGFTDSDGRIDLALGETIPMPEVTNASEMYNLFVKYYMSGSCVEVFMDDDGAYWLKAVAPGTGTLHAESYTKKSAFLTVNVAQAPTNVKVNVSDVVLVGETADVNVTFDNFSRYTLNVSDETLACITSDGKLKALKVGEVVLTVTLQNGDSVQKTVLLRNAPDYVELGTDAMTLEVGQSAQLEPVVDVNAYTTYTFVSSNPDIAEVSDTGMILAKAPGTARITVYTSQTGVFALCQVKVEAARVQPEIAFESNKLTMQVGQAACAVNLVLKEGQTLASVTCDQEALFESFKVEAGVVHIGKPLQAGKAVITATTESGVFATCSIEVKAQPAAITSNVSEVTLAAGETTQIAIGFAPENAWGNVVVESDDAGIATADENGIICAVAPGQTRIHFRTAGVEGDATVLVKVLYAPEMIHMDVESVDLIVGASMVLDAPELLSTQGASGGQYTWNMGDESIATIDAAGQIKALKAGTTSIKVRAYNGVSTYVPVTVWPTAEEISFAEESLVMAVGEKNSPVVLSENGAVVNAALSSDNEAAVRVENNQLVAVSSGLAVVTANYGDLDARIVVQVCKPTNNVTLNAERITLGVKERFAIKAQLDEGAASAGLEIHSSNSAIAAVNADGVITALHPGTVTITVTAFGGASDSMEVTVLAAPTGVILEPAEITGNVLESGVQLKWRFEEENQGGSVRFESEDEGVATVDGNGFVTFHKVGWTTIGIVTYNGRTDTVNVTVQRVPETMAFEKNSITIQKGDAVLNPVVMTKNSYASYELVSGDESILTVDADGYFHGIQAGTTTVKIQSACGLNGECTVTVVDKLAGMKVSESSLKLALGATATLKVSFTDKDAMANVRYVSSNPSIATVDEFTGKVSAVKKGSCTIYVQTLDGSNSAACKVTVNGPRYRMFLAYEYFSTEYSHNLAFSQNNVNTMKAAFGNSSINGVEYEFKTMKNPSKNSLLSGMASYFADSNENDINVIYLCSHGHKSINDTPVGGAPQYGISLQGYSTKYDADSPYYYVTATELYACISQVKGKVVLILDSCNSGQFIINMQSKLDRETDHRIAVLTAVQGGTNASYYNVTSTTQAVDFFTYFLAYGIGYDEKKDRHDYNLRADSNGSGKISLSEFFNYGRAATSSYVSKSSTYKAKWFHGSRYQVPQSYIKGKMGDLIVYDPK